MWTGGGCSLLSKRRIITIMNNTTTDSDASSTAADYVKSVGFWLSFTLIVGVSAVEALAHQLSGHEFEF